MKLMSAIVVMTLCSQLSAAQIPSEQNAALMYQRAFEQLQRFRESNPDAFMALMDFDPDAPATPPVRAALAQVQPMLEIVRQGAVMPSCEFPLDRSAGLAMLMPHLGQMRHIAKVMRVDAMVRLQDGDTTAAASSTADIYRISNHFNADGTIISSLVGNAIFALADGTVQYGVDRGVYGEDEGRILQEGMQRLNDIDPFNFAGSVAGERDMFGGWLKNRVAEEEEPGRILAELSGMGAGDLEKNDHPLMLMSKERFEQEVKLYDEVMGRMVDIFNMPDRDAAKIAIADMEEEIEAMHISAQHGGEGLLVGMLMPALGKAIEQRNRAEKMLSDRRAMLGALATGKASPRDFANAAIWYLRGIALLEQADPAILTQVRQLSDDAALPLSPELRSALEDKALQDVIDVFREGSMNRRCDFSLARQQRMLELLPRHVAGMHDGFRLLHADAIRLVRAGQTERAIDQLITCMRMAGHLGSDPVIISSLTAHGNFNKTIGFLRSALEGSDLNGQFAPALADALERIEMEDPFGYVKSIVAARTELSNRFLWLSRGLEDSELIDLRKRAIAESLRGLNADQTLHLLAVFDIMGHNAMIAAETAHAEKTGAPSETAAENSPEVRAQLLTRLKDVISLANLDMAQADSGRLAPLLYQGELHVLEGVAPAAVASSKWAKTLADHIRRAHHDVRGARTLARASTNKP
jgi:hypothetical protein